MKSVLIVENSTNSLKINESQSQKDQYVLGGIFTEFDVKNRNERVYTADRFLPCLNELNERIESFGVVYGEFDHPDVFDTSLSRSSHIVRKASFVKESNRIEGEIRLLNTYWGKEAKALVNDGCPIFVSSRAAGVTESDGTVTLKKLFTYDIVADPGFASAKMTVKTLNESLGYNAKANFRIYEMSDDSKINELFNMNANDFVTKKQLTDYSKYLVNELASTKKTVTSAISKGNINPKKLEQLLEYYEELNKTNGQIVKYLDYLAEKVQVMVTENTSLKSTTAKLIKHNDYLAENLEKAINYTEYVAESVDKNIEYSEYIAEQLDKNISYAEYIAENLDKSISYGEYLAENLDKNIAYSEYIAENLDKNIAYAEYIAENLDKSISYSGLIAERLNTGKLLENMGMEEERFPTLQSAGFDSVQDEEEDEEFGKEESHEEEGHEEEIHGDEMDAPSHEETPVMEEEEDEESYEEEGHEEDEESYEMSGDSDTELSQSIDKLIEEAKKRKASETTDLHFLKFLNKSQVDSFYNLTNEDQETVKLYISEKSFFSTSDVLKLVTEALSSKNETLEERVIRLMPENIKPIWNQLNENARKSILSQARLYPQEVMQTESQVEHFWMTRPNLKKNESVTKKLVAHDSLIQEDKLSDKELGMIMERFKNL